MPKKPDQAPETKPELTEWQKRNLEFLQKKKEREEEKKRLEEAERKQARLQAVAAPETEAGSEVKEISEEAPSDSETSRKTEEDKTKQSWLKQGLTFKNRISLKPKKSRREVLRGVGVTLLLLISIFTLLISAFMASPYSKAKVIKVAGENYATASDIETAANISKTSYLTDLIFNDEKYEQSVVKGNIWVKSANLIYRFPNSFTIQVEEHEIIAYATIDGGYQPILEDGSLVSTTTVETLPEGALVINLADAANLKTFLKKMTKLDASLISEIQTIDLANSSSTADLLLITMRDGNSVRVPLSELDQKLPYYDKLAKNLVTPAIVDMEVGIYVTNTTVEEALAVSRAENQTDDESTESDSDVNAESEDSAASTEISEEQYDTSILEESESQE